MTIHFQDLRSAASFRYSNCPEISILCVHKSPFRSGLRAVRYSGCLPFTKTFRKFRLESKWYTTFRFVPVGNFREQRNVQKGSPVFPDGTFQTEIRVPFVQTSSLIPVSGSRGHFRSLGSLTGRKTSLLK